MALALLTPSGTSVNEFGLHVFELAYVLSLMGVQSAVGLPTAVLFPKDPAVRKKALEDGERRLIANRLLTPRSGHNGDFNDDLLSMVAAVADPRLSILTRRETSQGRADATIYLNNVEVVTVTQTDRQAFTVKRLQDAAEAFQVVRKTLAISPLSRHANQEFEISVEQFDKARQHVARKETSEAIADLVDGGMDATVAEGFVTTMCAPEHKGLVSLHKHGAHKITDVRVMGYYHHASDTWITSVNESSNRVRIEAVDSEGFVRRLVDRMSSVCK